MEPSVQTDPIVALQSHVGLEWPAVNQAQKRALATYERLDKVLAGLPSTDAAIVVFGSLARREWTQSSDVDWTLLIDGQADPEHLGLAQKVAGRLEMEGFPAPGRSGIFGSMTFSHDLVQKIGGREDTNENTTRSVLLIQESRAFGKPDAYTRTLKHIFSRYLKDDRGLRFGSLPSKVPRVLINDIIRYWRTITVDFVDKQRGHSGQGWALRNAKLRMSRKLLYATGMLTCFSCEMLISEEAREDLQKNHSTVRMEEHLLRFIQKTPLEILATFLVERKIKKETTVKLFSSYNAFLALLDDADKRDRLKKLSLDEIPTDAVFGEIRSIGRTFQQGLTALFFHDDEQLRDLTIFYGVF
jgi:predicted nucleotidyltransferase